MRWPALSGETAGRWLRRGVLAIGAAALMVLPQFTTNASFVGVRGLPGPLTVLWVGLALWLMPVLLVLSWAAGGRVRLRHGWLAVPAALLVAGAVVSTAVASDKASALVRAAEISGLWVGLFALVQAVRSDGERRFVLSVLVAVAVATALAAIYQAMASLPETWDYFQANRDQVLAEHGIEPGSWTEHLFVNRFLGGVQATMGHPNVLASFLTLGLFVTVGLVREKWTEAASRGARGLAVGLIAVAVLCAIGIVLTQSRAAQVAVVVGLWWLGVHWRVRRRGLRVALYLAPLALGAVVLAAATQIETLAASNALLTLRYRLQYWQATFEVLRHGWDTGVGLENFGSHYLEHKLPWAVEEVSDPHNLLLSMWSMLGLAGATALVLLVFGAVRHWRRGPTDPGPAALFPPRGEPLLALLVPTVLVAAPGVAYFYANGPFVGVAALAIMTMVIGLGACEEPSRLSAAGRPLGSLRAACIAALAAFGLQELIGTAILAPAAAWAALVVLGMSLGPGAGARMADDGPAPPGNGTGGSAAPPAGWALNTPMKFLVTLAAMGLCFGYVTRIIMPVSREQALLEYAGMAGNTYERDDALRAAAAANPLAWEPDFVRGRFWQDEVINAEGPAAAIALERSMQGFQDAVKRHPRLREAYLGLAESRLGMPGGLEDPEALAMARACLEEVSRLSPTDLPTRVRLADLIDRQGDDRAALDAYREALRLDALMPEPRLRLPEAQRAAIENRIRLLSETVASPPPVP